MRYQQELEKQLVQPGVGVPVDEPQVVARDVVAEVGELDGLPATLAAALALHLALEDLAAVDVELVELGQERRIGPETVRRVGGDPAAEATAVAGEAVGQAFAKIIRKAEADGVFKEADAKLKAAEGGAARLHVAAGERLEAREAIGEEVQAVERAVANGRLGRLTLCSAYVKWWRTQAYYDGASWRGTRDLDGGGAMMNQAIHSVDLLVWLMGPVKQISAMTSTLPHERIEVEDVAVANLKFESGALGVIEATTTAYPGALKRIEICGSEGSAVLEEEDIKQWDFANETPEDKSIRDEMSGKTESGGGASDPSAIDHGGHTHLFEEAVAAINENRPSILDGYEGRRSVEVICAVYESARTGKIVNL